MKNKKRFQRLMLSAAALLMVIPLTSQSHNAQASETTQMGGHQPGLINTYGLEPNLSNGKGGYTGSNGRIGISLRRTTYKGHKTPGTDNANYVHKHKLTGFLVRNGSISGEPFGPNKRKFKTSKEGTNGNLRTWIVYTYPKDSEAGKVGMYYKDALLYYPNSKKNKPVTPTHLDARLIWNGTYRPQGVNGNNNLQFSTKNISIKEPYQGAANFTLKLYYSKGKNKGKPFKAIKTQIMQTDIDYKQGLVFNTPSYLIYDKSTKLNAGYTQTWNTYVPGKTTVFGDLGKKHGIQGTVLPEQKEGQITYVPKSKTNSFNVTFVHSYESVPVGYQSTKFASPASDSVLKKLNHSVKSLKSLPNHYDQNKNNRYETNSKVSGGQSDYFGFEFDKGNSNTTYNVDADKLVGTKDHNFKKTTKNKPLTVKDDQTIYFDIHTQLKEPTSALVKSNNTNKDYNALPIKDALNDKNDPNLGKAGLTDAKKDKQRLVLRDYLDPRFEVAGDIKVYYSKKWNDTNLSGGKKNASKYFYTPYHAKATKGKYKGYTVIDAAMKPDAMKLSSDAWWKDYHLVIPVKLKKGVSPSNGSKSKGWILLSNKAYVNNDGGGKSWVKFKFTHETVKADGKPGVDSKKEVYDANLADPDKLGKKLSWGTNDSNAKLNGDIVNPDQYLYYRLRFTIRPMKAHQKKNSLVIIG